MSLGQGIKLEKTQKVYSPELLEANALEAGNIISAYPWLVRLDHYADETGSNYWKQRVKDIYSEYGFDLGTTVSLVGGSDKQLGERIPPENLQGTNQIFVSLKDNKKINYKRLWEWTLNNFVDNINHRYEWVAGLLFFGNQQLLMKELNKGITPTTTYGTQMREWFGQVWNIECSDDQINEYRNGFFKSSNFNYSVWLNDIMAGPKQNDFRGDQTLDGFENIRKLCTLLEKNFNLKDIIDTP